MPNGKRFAIALALGIEVRGKHATGFGWAEQGDDENIYYAKRKGKAAQVAPSMPLGKGIHTLMAHTRHATTGDPSVYDNNHPVVNGPVVAIHNGRIDNHDELITVSGVERVGEVDSFALAAVLNSPEMNFDSPVEVLELIEGVAAVAWMDAEDVNALHLARLSTRPLTYGFTKRGDFVFSSTRKTLAASSKMARQVIQGVVEVPEGTYMRIEGGQITDRERFTVRTPKVVYREDVPGNQNGSRRGKRPIPQAPLPFNGTDIDWWAEYDQYEADRMAEAEALWDAGMAEDIDWSNLVPRRGWK